VNSQGAALRRCIAGWLATVAASAALFAVLHGREFYLRAAGVATLVAVLGALGRAIRMPASFVALVQLTASFFYLVATYASDQARSGFLPNTATIDRMRALWTGGFDQFDKITPPVTPTPEIAFIAVSGVAVAAVLVDVLAAGYRQTALAGLPLLTLYVVPVSVRPDEVAWYLFAAPALAFLLLLAADSRDRLLAWGVPIGGRAEAGAGSRGPNQLSRMSRRIGVAVLSLSVVIPAATPRLTHGAFGSKGVGDAKGKTISTLNPLVTMRRDLVRPADVDLLTMRTTADRPSDQYLRTVTLDEFDGVEWKAGRREVHTFNNLPDVQGLSPSVSTSPVLTQITAAPTLQSDYLPMTFPATKLDLTGEWRLDDLTDNVVSHKGRKQISGTHWTVQSLDIALTKKDVVNATPTGNYLTRYLRLPEDIPTVVKETARRVTKGANNPLEIGAALQAWFREPGNFVYDLSTAPGSGNNALVEFLRDRRGYCEQFAATMAVMARQLGVPARVNVGFTAGRLADDGLSRTISAHDAHAWPELWIPNVGWMRFEPTPGSANSNPSAPNFAPLLGKGVQDPDRNDDKNEDKQNDKPQDAAAGAGGNQGPGDGGQTQAQPTPVPCEAGTHFNSATAGCDPDLAVWWKRWWKWELLGAALLLLLAAPALSRELIRRRRWLVAGRSRSGSEVAEIAWQELGDDAVDLGLVWPAARTPRRTLAEVGADARLTAEGLAALSLLCAAVERSRYAREGVSGVDPARMRTAVLVVATQLGVRAGRWRRFVAKVAPASVWFGIRESLAGAATRRARPRQGLNTQASG
jgi:transglutaminase-like putative cysteine protease